MRPNKKELAAIGVDLAMAHLAEAKRNLPDDPAAASRAITMARKHIERVAERLAGAIANDKLSSTTP